MSELIQGVGPRTIQETRSVTWITSAAAVLSAGLTALFALWAATGHDEVVLASPNANGASGASGPSAANGATAVAEPDEVEIDYEHQVPIAVSPSGSTQPPAQARPTLRPAPTAPKAAPPTAPKPVAATGAS
jgi:hypothetical protein